MNNKMQTASVSLIGAIPGIALSVILIMALINHFNEMSAMYTTLAGVTLAVSVCLAVLPLAIVVFGPKAGNVATAAEPQAVAAEEEIHAQAVEEELELDDDLDDFEETHNESEEFFTDGSAEAEAGAEDEFDEIDVPDKSAVEIGDISGEDDLDFEDDLFVEGASDEFDLFDEEEKS